MAYSVSSVDIYDLAANMPAGQGGSQLAVAQDTGLLYQFVAGAWVPLGGAPRVVSITSSATPTINAAVTDQFEITALAVAITGFTVTGTPVDGQNQGRLPGVPVSWGPVWHC
jgi:hypothetical protein